MLLLPTSRFPTAAADGHPEQGSSLVSPPLVPGHLHTIHTAGTALASKEWKMPSNKYGHDGTLARWIHLHKSAACAVSCCA